MLPLHALFLKNLALPHAVIFGAIVSISELLIAISMVVGIPVRFASLSGLTMMLVFLFSSNYPGARAPIWEFFGASLEHSVLALCFITFMIAHPAGGQLSFAGNSNPTCNRPG